MKLNWVLACLVEHEILCLLFMDVDSNLRLERWLLVFFYSLLHLLLIPEEHNQAICKVKVVKWLSY